MPVIQVGWGFCLDAAVGDNLEQASKSPAIWYNDNSSNKGLLTCECWSHLANMGVLSYLHVVPLL